MSAKRDDAFIALTIAELTFSSWSRSYPETSICNGLAKLISDGRENSYCSPGTVASRSRMTFIACASSSRVAPGSSDTLNVPV